MNFQPHQPHRDMALRSPIEFKTEIVLCKLWRQWYGTVQYSSLDLEIKNMKDMGHSENWTRDLSHPKRESYH